MSYRFILLLKLGHIQGILKEHWYFEGKMQIHRIITV